MSPQNQMTKFSFGSLSEPKQAKKNCRMVILLYTQLQALLILLNFCHSNKTARKNENDSE